MFGVHHNKAESCIGPGPVSRVTCHGPSMDTAGPPATLTRCWLGLVWTLAWSSELPSTVSSLRFHLYCAGQIFIHHGAVYEV